MLERHKKRLEEIAHRNSKMRLQTLSPVLEVDHEKRRIENKKIIHEILQQCKIKKVLMKVIEKQELIDKDNQVLLKKLVEIQAGKGVR